MPVIKYCHLMLNRHNSDMTQRNFKTMKIIKTSLYFVKASLPCEM